MPDVAGRGWCELYLGYGISFAFYASSCHPPYVQQVRDYRRSRTLGVGWESLPFRIIQYFDVLLLEPHGDRVNVGIVVYARKKYVNHIDNLNVLWPE